MIEVKAKVDKSAEGFHEIRFASDDNSTYGVMRMENAGEIKDGETYTLSLLGASQTNTLKAHEAVAQANSNQQ